MTVNNGDTFGDTSGRETHIFSRSRISINLYFVAEAEGEPNVLYEWHSAPKSKPNFGRSLHAVGLTTHGVSMS